MPDPHPPSVDADGVIEAASTELVPAGLEAALTVAAAAGAMTADIATIPEAVEFGHLCQMARVFSMSELAPKHLRGKPYDTLVIFLTARDLGIPLTSAVRKVSVIEGQPSIDTELQLALVRQRGFGAVLPIEENFTQTEPLYAGAQALGPNGQPMGPVVLYTWQDAQTAGYVDPECMPLGHHIRSVTKGSGDRKRTVQGCLCKDNWRTVPRDMLWNRAAARCRRIFFPEATTGMYDADELGGVIDVEGRLVEPTSVPLPDGYEDPKERRQQQQAAQDQPCSTDDLWALQERINALPAATRTEMREAWKGNERLQAYAPRCVGPDERILPLPQRLHTLAKNMLNGWEAKAKQKDKSWDRDVARTQLREEVGYQIFAELIPAMWSPSAAASDYPAGDQAIAERAVQMAAAIDADVAAEEATTTPVAAPAAPEADPGPDTAQAAPEAQDDEPDPEPEDDGKDWSAELADAAGMVAGLAGLNGPFTSGVIEAEIKGMHWQRVNQALEKAGASTEGPIDLRRMRLAVIRHNEYQEPF